MFKSLYQKSLVRFCYNLKSGALMVEEISAARIFWFRKSSTKVHMRENCIIVPLVTILTGVAC